MKTLDELWYGNISPFEQCTRGGKRLKELLKLVARNREELDGTLTNKQKETLEKFEECMNEMAVPIAREERRRAERSVRMQKGTRQDPQASRVRARTVPRHAPYLRFQRLPLRHGRQDLGEHDRTRKRGDHTQCIRA